MTNSSRVWLATAILVFLSACGGGGGDSAENVIQSPPAPPQDGVSGRVVSRISGATITVHDANGDEVVIASGRTTRADGTFSIIFSEFAIESGINPPLVLTLEAGGATATCDFDKDGNNDCMTPEGSFVAFGETYSLPADFTLRGVAPTFPPAGSVTPRTVTVNISATSDMAVHLAERASAGAALTEEVVTLAGNQALGVTEFVTGLNTGGLSLNNIPIIDLSTSGTTSNASLAMALFTASIHGHIDPDIAGRSSYRRALNVLNNGIYPYTQSMTNQLQTTGSFIANAVRQFITTATFLQANLNEPLPVLTGAVAAQTAQLDLLNQIAGNRLLISLPADPGSSEPLDQSRLFVSRLSEAMGSSLQISETFGFGGTVAGAETVYVEQIALIDTLVSSEIETTLAQLNVAIADALATSTTELNGTNVSGALSFDGNTATLTTTTSSTTNIQTGISVNLTVSNGTWTNPGAAGSLDGTEVAINVTQTLNDITTQQIYTGALQVNFDDAGTALNILYSGDVRARDSLNFSGEIAISGLSAADQAAGSYDANYSFNDGSTLALSGTFATLMATYSITTSTSPISVDLVLNKVTDLTVDLMLNLSGSTVTGGTLMAGDTQTGTMDAAGVITFIDDTTTALPAPIL